jgi:hypothetical protein
MGLIEFFGEIFTRGSDQLTGRITGPLNIRLILTPAMAAFFAIRDGVRAARSGHPSFFWEAVRSPEERKARLRAGWASLKRVVLLGFVIDLIYQFYVFRAYYVFQTVILVLVLAVLPYILIHAVTTRMATPFLRNKE